MYTATISNLQHVCELSHPICITTTKRHFFLPQSSYFRTNITLRHSISDGSPLFKSTQSSLIYWANGYCLFNYAYSYHGIACDGFRFFHTYLMFGAILVRYVWSVTYILYHGIACVRKLYEWCFRPRFCTVKLYWAGANLG